MIEHGEITLRAVEERDLENLRALRNHPSTRMQLTNSSEIDAEAQKRWFRSLEGRTDRRYFTISAKGIDFLGLVRMDEIDTQNRSIRVGADVALEQRGKGWGSKTYAAVLDYCFGTLRMHRVWLCVLETNKAARALYQKCGFLEEGRQREAIFRDGKFHDYIVMSILENEYRKGAKQ